MLFKVLVISYIVISGVLLVGFAVWSRKTITVVKALVDEVNKHRAVIEALRKKMKL